MKKFNNKGLTLLELIIAMSILTSVMFIGYNIFNKYSTLMHTQVNINKGQLNMNTINEYLTKDLEQTTSIELKIDGVVVADTKVDVEQKSTDKVLESAKQKIEDRLSANNNFNYEYKLRFNDESKFSIYKVNIEKNNKAIKYTVSLTDKNGTKVDFINKELLREKEVPFYIMGDDPYKVSMGYSDKKNKFNLHEFEVTSRIKQDLVAGEVMPQPPTEPDASEPSAKPDTPQSPTEPDSTKPPTDDNLSNKVNGDLIFEVSNIVQGTNSNQRTITQIVKSNKDNEEVVLKEQIAKDVGDNNIKETQCYMFINKEKKFISLFMQPGISQFSIYQNQIDKDISKISKIRVFLDDNISLVRSDGLSFLKVNDYYEATLNHFEVNTNMYFDFSNIEKSDVKNGKVYIELIEE